MMIQAVERQLGKRRGLNPHLARCRNHRWDETTDYNIHDVIRETGWYFLRTAPNQETAFDSSQPENRDRMNSVVPTGPLVIDPGIFTSEDLNLILESAREIHCSRAACFQEKDPGKNLAESVPGPENSDSEMSVDHTLNEEYRIVDVAAEFDTGPKLPDNGFEDSASLHAQEWIYEDLDEFQEAIEGEEFNFVDADGLLSRRERAFQVAERVAAKFGWESDGIHLLAEVFEAHGWNAARRAMENLLEEGLQPGELALARHVREMWEECAEFRTRVPYSPSGSWVLPFRQLSWPYALSIVRSFDSYADLAEIRELLLELFENWASSPGLIRNFRSFFSYLVHCLRHCRNGSLWFMISAHDAFNYFQESDPADHINYQKEMNLLNYI